MQCGLNYFQYQPKNWIHFSNSRARCTPNNRVHLKISIMLKYICICNCNFYLHRTWNQFVIYLLLMWSGLFVSRQFPLRCKSFHTQCYTLTVSSAHVSSPNFTQLHWTQLLILDFEPKGGGIGVNYKWLPIVTFVRLCRKYKIQNNSETSRLV